MSSAADMYIIPGPNSLQYHIIIFGVGYQSKFVENTVITFHVSLLVRKI